MRSNLSGDQLELKPDTLTGQSAVRKHIHHGHHGAKKKLKAVATPPMNATTTGNSSFVGQFAGHEDPDYFSGADASKTTHIHIDIKSIAIGMAVGAIGFWMAKKYNIL